MRIFLLSILLFSLPFVGQSQFKEKIEGQKTEFNPEGLQFSKINSGDQRAEGNIKHITFSLSDRLPIQQLNTQYIHKKVLKVNGRVKSISGLPLKQTGQPEDKMTQFFDFYKEELGVKSDQIKKQTSKIGEDGRQHIKLQQTYKGLPVYGRQATLHGTDRGFDFYLGNFESVTLDNTEADLSKTGIVQILQDRHGMSQDSRDMPTGLKRILNTDPEIKLVIYKDKDKTILAYHAIFYPDGIHRKEAILNADNGEIIKEFDAYCKFHNHASLTIDVMPPSSGSGLDLFGNNRSFNTWLDGSTHLLLDATRAMFNSSASDMPNDPVGAIWTLSGNGEDPQSSQFGVGQITSSSTSWNNGTAVSAHLNGAKSYEYFLNTFGRNSINGQGGTIVSILNAGAGNAFWNGQAIFYGNADNSFQDLARGLDVAGHEMSHGVIQNTANLEYYGESGALNESYADIFGAMIDRDDWLIGEDVVRSSSFPSGALRSMSNPHNGGSGLQDVNRGWQPDKYSEKFNGSEDNNGVHINSGIVNRAYYLFANNNNVGKAKAEQVYFKVLDDYLTRSSDFADLRAALEQVVSNDYGMSSAEWTALQNALNTTQLPGGGGVIDNPELETNPGDDLFLVTTDTQEGIYTANSLGQDIALLTSENIISRPSVTDDGSVAVFVDGDKNLRFMLNFPGTNDVDYLESTPEPIWRNVIISKNATHIAALTDSVNNAIYIFNLDWQNNGQASSRRYELYNPTFTDGVTTGDVLYADAMEFSADGEYIIYDAINRIQNNSGEDIEYWDIAFIDIWDGSNEVYRDGRIQKLFNQLPEDVSIGNPTFSKNSPNVIAFDLLENNDWSILGMNIETNEYRTIVANNKIGYPTYAPDDTRIAFDYDDDQGAAIYRIGVNDAKIEGVGDISGFLVDGAHWAVWYGNGERVLVDAEDLEPELTIFNLYPNPAQDVLEIKLESIDKLVAVRIEVFNALGQLMLSQINNNVKSIEEQLDIRHLEDGVYFLQISSEEKRLSRSFVKSK